MIIRGSFSQFYLSTMLPALHHVIKAQGKKIPPQYPKIFRSEDTTRSIEQVTGISGVGLFTQLGENEPVRWDDPEQGYPKTFQPVRFGLGIQASRDAIEDDKIGLITRRAIALERSGRETIEIQAASVFNNAFSGSYLGPDGVCLCSDSHPLYKAGGVQSNLLAVAADLAVASLELMMTAYETQVDDTGLEIRMPAPRVVVAPENRWNVNEILQSNLRSDTANNTTNAFQYAEGGLPTAFIWRYLTDPDAWFLVAPPEETELVIFWRRRPYNHGWFDDDTEAGKLARRYKMDYGFAHYLGVYGTPGAG